MDNGKVLIVRVKHVYGKKLVYPTIESSTLEKLTGQTTLSQRHIEALKELGFQFRVLPETM